MQSITQHQELSRQHIEAVISMWNSEFPASIGFDSMEGLEAYLAKLKQQRHFIVEQDNMLRAWLCVFERDGEDWFIIIIHHSSQKQGYGKQLLKAAMEQYDSLKGWITSHSEYSRADGTAYPSPKVFYQKLGFEVKPEVTLTKGGITSVLIEWKKTQ